MLKIETIEKIIKNLLVEYHAESVILFGSYARGEATEQSDIDIVICGGRAFKKTDVFAFAEDFRNMTGKSADVFELSEVNINTPFYDNIMKEGLRIA